MAETDDKRCGTCRWFIEDAMEDGPYGACALPAAWVNKHGTTRRDDGTDCPCHEPKGA